MNVQQIIHDIVSDTGTLVLVLLFLFGTLTVTIRTLGSTIRSVSKERSRREIAAYIAEGSMTPEQGERLMKAEDRRV